MSSQGSVVIQNVRIRGISLHRDGSMNSDAFKISIGAIRDKIKTEGKSSTDKQKRIFVVDDTTCSTYYEESSSSAASLSSYIRQIDGDHAHHSFGDPNLSQNCALSTSFSNSSFNHQVIRPIEYTVNRRRQCDRALSPIRQMLTPKHSKNDDIFPTSDLDKSPSFYSTSSSDGSIKYQSYQATNPVKHNVPERDVMKNDTILNSILEISIPSFPMNLFIDGFYNPSVGNLAPMKRGMCDRADSPVNPRYMASDGNYESKYSTSNVDGSMTAKALQSSSGDPCILKDLHCSKQQLCGTKYSLRKTSKSRRKMNASKVSICPSAIQTTPPARFSNDLVNPTLEVCERADGHLDLKESYQDGKNENPVSIFDKLKKKKKKKKKEDRGKVTVSISNSSTIENDVGPHLRDLSNSQFPHFHQGCDSPDCVVQPKRKRRIKSRKLPALLAQDFTTTDATDKTASTSEQSRVGELTSLCNGKTSEEVRIALPEAMKIQKAELTNQGSAPIKKAIGQHASRNAQLAGKLSASETTVKLLLGKIADAQANLNERESRLWSTKTRVLRFVLEDTDASIYKATFHHDHLKKERGELLQHLQESKNYADRLQHYLDQNPTLDDLDWKNAIEQTCSVLDLPSDLPMASSTTVSLVSEVKAIEKELRTKNIKINNLRQFESGIVLPGQSSVTPTNVDIITADLNRKIQDWESTRECSNAIINDLLAEKDRLHEMKAVQVNILAGLEERLSDCSPVQVRSE